MSLKPSDPRKRSDGAQEDPWWAAEDIDLSDESMLDYPQVSNISKEWIIKKIRELRDATPYNRHARYMNRYEGEIDFGTVPGNKGKIVTVTLEGARTEMDVWAVNFRDNVPEDVVFSNARIPEDDVIEIKVANVVPSDKNIGVVTMSCWVIW